MFAKIYNLHWDAGRANILCKYLIHKFFQLWAWLCGSFFLLFSEAPASSDKIFFWIFTALCFYLHDPKKYVSDFKNLFSNWKYYFCPAWCLFWLDIFNQKASFLTKKNQRWNLRHTLVEKLSKFNVAKY